MAGTFAHITLVDTLCADGKLLQGIGTLSPAIIRSLMRYMNFCELGAVSPDYPYMALLDSNSAGWANMMHYFRTADLARRAVQIIYRMDYRQPGTQRCIAWLFGYAAHLVTDLTIHPVVIKRVGPYKGHEGEHRQCEMNQDVYIFNARQKQEITTAEYVRDAGIVSCSDQADGHKLDPAVSAMWLQCLMAVPRKEIKMKAGIPGPTGAPALDKWHRAFVFLIDKIAEEGGRLPPLSRHFAQDKALVYREYKDIDRSYIDGLETPEGANEDYDAVFDRAQKNVIETWRQLGAALDKGDPTLLSLVNGDLDTGAAESGKLIYWEAVA